MFFSPDRFIGLFRGKVTDFGGAIGLRSKFHEVPKPKGLYVIIPIWKDGTDYYKLIRKRIRLLGYSCIEYRIASALLSPDYKYTDQAFKEVINQVRLDIEKMVAEKAFKEVKVIGFSVGCIEAAMIANYNPYVTKLVLVAPGNCLAESMWYGLKTRNIKQLFEKQGIDLPFLKKAWKDLAPENNFHGLAGKEIEIYLSKCDINIPYRLGRKLADAMIAHGLKPKVYENKYLGHYLTVSKYLLMGKIS